MRKVNSVSRSAPAEKDDLYQEGMLGLLYAARTFDSKRSGCFEAYAGMCIKSRIIDFIRKQTADNKKAVLLTHKLEGGSDVSVFDPEEAVLSEEKAREITERLKNCFSQLEKEVFSLYIEGLTASDIAKSLKKDRKTVENAVTRIRKKLKEACKSA